MFGLKIWQCKNLDKYHACVRSQLLELIVLFLLERTLTKFVITLEVKWLDCSAVHIVGVSRFFDYSMIFLMLALFYNSRDDIRRRYAGTYCRYVYLSYFLLTDWLLEYSNREPWGCGAQDLSLSWLKEAFMLHECSAAPTSDIHVLCIFLNLFAGNQLSHISNLHLWCLCFCPTCKRKLCYFAVHTNYALVTVYSEGKYETIISVIIQLQIPD